jgi:methionyl-tRNA synthetase
MREQATVYVVPPPTTNGPLHLGHLSGPYLASDIAARAGRERGERVLELGGVDVHQNYVLTRAQSEGVAVERMIADYRRRISHAYELAGIEPDASVDPQDPEHQRLVASLIDDLVADGTLVTAATTLHACGDCGRTTSRAPARAAEAGPAPARARAAAASRRRRPCWTLGATAAAAPLDHSWPPSRS